MPADYNPDLDIDNLHITPGVDDRMHASSQGSHNGAADVDIVQASMALKDAAYTLGNQLKATVAVADAFITKAVKESPLATLGGAAGAGFLVGGGFGAPLTRSLLRIGLKAGGAFVLDSALSALKSGIAPANAHPGTDDSTRASRRTTSSEDSPSMSTSINTGEES